MNWGRLRGSGRENVFKGSQLVSNILERHPKHFRSRATALKFCRQLFNDGIIRGVFGADSFEDSVQLYTWKDENGKTMNSMPVHSPSKPSGYGYSGADVTLTKRDLYKQKVPIKAVDDEKVVAQQHPSSTVAYSSDVTSYFKDLENGVPEESEQRITKQISSYQTSWNLQRASTASSESSVDILSHSYQRHKDKNSVKTSFNVPTVAQTRDHDVIPEEVQEEHVMERTATSIDYDGSSSIPRSVTTDMSNDVEHITTQRRWPEYQTASIPRSAATTDISNDTDSASTQRRWLEYQNSYSDNEKQLIEQMKRMKKEHSHILRTYEDRINKLMAKMHELRSIAEMLENSSTKSSPYGMIPTKSGILTFLGSKPEDRKNAVPSSGSEQEQAPPLPPRPGRGNRLNPNKPVIQTDAKMKPLPWVRIILKDSGEEEPATIWHTMMEPKLDPEEIERYFSNPEISQTDGATLYDDLIIRRGRSRQQLVSIYDKERSKRIVICMKCLRATLTDVTGTVSSLDTSQIHHDGLAELLELLTSIPDIDKILYHVRKRGAGHLDHPEYLVFELSKVDHFKDRLEFIRFRYKTQWHLFEIDQQLRELHTACDEITNSTSLKHLLETLLSVGNYLNGATDMGQADGYGLDVLNQLKDLQDRDGKGTLLEFVLKTYCQVYENEVDIGCPTRFRLPEPSNMRHAAQVSFEGIQDALSNLHADLGHVREKLLDPKVNKDTTRPMDSFRVTAENFFAAALEVIGEQEKILQDTRDMYDKTVTYFMMNKQEVTPQQFFTIWAIFLHDCKYFWKLAHRRLAKERFELEFKYKGQMSACSLHGYGGFKAGVMLGMDSGRPTDPKTSTYNRHINKWIHNVDDHTRPPVPPKPSRDEDTENIDVIDHCHRSPSPKPLTSTPPTSGDVHKPLPKAPIVTPVPMQNGSVPLSPPNYENQSEYDRLHSRQSSSNVKPTFTTSDNRDLRANLPYNNTYSPNTKEKKASQHFSLKTWLKRERDQVRRDVENEVIEPPNEPKPQSQPRSFTRLKNSMIQRFSGGSSNKKLDSSSKRSKDVNDAITPQKVNRYDVKDNHVLPYDVLRNNYPVRNEANHATDEIFANGNDQNIASHDYTRSLTDTVISPIDDPDNEEITIPPQVPHVHANYGIVRPEIRVANDKVDSKSDVNNNDRYGYKGKGNPLMPWKHEKQDSEARDEVSSDPRLTQDHNYTSPNYDGNMVNSGAESKRVKAQPVPVYKAKIINNYENQGKFESTNAIRQQAEPVHQNNNSYLHQEVYLTNDQNHNTNNTKNDFQSVYPRFSQVNQAQHRDTNGGSTNNPHGLNENPTRFSHAENNSRQSHNDNHFNPYSQSLRLDTQLDGTRSDNGTPKKPKRLDNQKFLTPGNRAPMNVQSIGSLIDKFDKYNNNEEPSNATHQGSDNNNTNTTESLASKPLTMTSTPVAPRRGLSNSDISEISPPLPPRSTSSDRTVPQDDNASSQNRSKYRSNDTSSSIHHKYTSPYVRLDNLTLHQGSTPSTYDSPRGNSSYRSPPNNLTSPSGMTDLYNAPPNMNNFTSPPSTNNNGTRHSYYSSSTHNFSNQHSHDPSQYREHDNNSRNDHAHHNGRVHFIDNADQSEERDDGYRAQLRRAANFKHSAFDRYNKPPQYTGRTSIGSMQPSPGSIQHTPASNRYNISTFHQSPVSTAVVQPSVHNNDEVAYMAI